MTKWTEEAIEALRRLARSELTGKQIAEMLSEEFGAKFTKNAVLGKADRLGVKMFFRPGALPPAEPRVPKPRRDPKPKNHAKFVWGGRMTARPTLVVVPPPVEEIAIPESQRVTLEELRLGQCLWPLGDPASEDFRYCGGKCDSVVDSYCRGHRALAYVPIVRKKKPAWRAAG